MESNHGKYATSSCNSQQISPDEVLSAPRLASQGEQRLRTIIPGEQNNFSFCVSFGDKLWALVDLQIEPIASSLARHALYAVTGSFSPSHDSVHSSQVLSAAQLVYDTYIRVTPLRLTEDLYFPPQTSACRSYAKLRSFERRTALTPNSAFHPSSLSTPDCEDATAIAPRSLDATAQASKDTITFTAPIAHDAHSSSQSMIVQPPNGGMYRIGSESSEPVSTFPNDQIAERLDPIVKGLVNAVISGQKKRRNFLKKRNKTQVEVIKYHSLIPQHLLYPADGKSLSEYLDRLEKALCDQIQDEKGESMRKIWNTWFYLSCLRIVRERIDNTRAHRSSKAASIVNDVVNRLLITDGVKAMGVYDGLSERHYKLGQAAKAKKVDAEYIAEQAAKALHDKVVAPPDASQVPFPSLWLHTVTKVPYFTICNEIKLSNLAMLHYVTDKGSPTMPVDITMSWIRREWTAYSSNHNTLTLHGRQDFGTSSKSQIPAQDGPQLAERHLHNPQDNGFLLLEPTSSSSNENLGQDNNVVDTLATNIDADFPQDCPSNFDEILRDSNIFAFDFDIPLAFPT